MSHIATVKSEIKDLDALDAACRELGFHLNRNQRTCDFWPEAGTPQKHPCDHAIALPSGSYKMELGLVRNVQGTYDLVGDDLLKEDGEYWNKEIFGMEKNPLGTNYGRLLQHYAIAKSTIECKKRGYLVTRSVIPGTQKVQLRVTGM